MSPKLTRRQALASSAAALAAAGLSPDIRCFAAAEAAPPKFSFFLIGDTHYLADEKDAGHMSAPSAEICRSLVNTLNRLPGEPLPAEVGGGKIVTPKGVVHVGDVIDTGDKTGSVHEEMQKTEWKSFEAD